MQMVFIYLFTYQKGAGVGVTKAPFVKFSVSWIFDLAKVPAIFFTFMFDSWAAATPVKYKCDIE